VRQDFTARDSLWTRGSGEVADGDGVAVLDGGDEAPVASGVDSVVLKQGETMRKMRLNRK
jgi:hypothetical protein